MSPMPRYTVTPGDHGGYTVRRYGCLSRVLTWLLVLVLLGLLVKYWYVTLPGVVAIGTGLLIWYGRARRGKQGDG